MIKTISLSKHFNNKIALDNLNLHIKKGEFYCLLGPNGAGKTTTLKLLTGLIKPTKGNIYINGLDITKHPRQTKEIMGFIPDSPFVYENLTAREFLTFIGNIFNTEKKMLDKKIEEYFNLFGIKPYENYLLSEYSHGMKQKIVYISNFLHNPQVLFIDEPLVGLDPQSIYLIKNILLERVKKGLTILMCTHILNIAEELADRIGILYEGKLIAEGNLEELRNNVNKESLEEIFLTLTKAHHTNFKDST